MFGSSDESNVVQSDSVIIVFNVENVNDERPQFQQPGAEVTKAATKNQQ